MTNDTTTLSNQNPAPWNPIGKLRKIYLAFFLLAGPVGLLMAGFAAISMSPNMSEAGWGIWSVSHFAFLASFLAALRYGLDYSWARIIRGLVIILFLPVLFGVLVALVAPILSHAQHDSDSSRGVSFLYRFIVIILEVVGVIVQFIPLIVIAILDRRLFHASRQDASVLPHAAHLASCTRGTSYRVLLWNLFFLLSVSAFTSGTILLFRGEFTGMDVRLPALTVFLLYFPPWAYCSLFTLICFALVICHFTLQASKLKVRIGIGTCLFIVGLGLIYCIAMFGPLITIIRNMSA
jgi:hypothetical protein